MSDSTNENGTGSDAALELSEHDHRDCHILIWRTDDPMEPPEDEPEAEGPFDVGDWYFAIKEWGLQCGASLSTLDQALKTAEAEIDEALATGVTPVADSNVWFVYR